MHMAAVVISVVSGTCGGRPGGLPRVLVCAAWEALVLGVEHQRERVRRRMRYNKQLLDTFS